jgi:hypothetical protein
MKTRRSPFLKILGIMLYLFLLVLVGLVGIFIGTVVLGDYSPNMLLELAAGETPQAKITAYLSAIQSQDREAALAAWTDPGTSSAQYAELSARREQVTDELLARQITSFTVFEPQWWSTCCGQGVTPHARNAGGARVPVQVLDAQGQPWGYVFDVFVDGTVYFGDAEGNPYRRWLLRDAYPHGERPLYWTLVYSGSVHAP